jgi:molybdate transport system substrate-binding protein
LHRRDAKDAEEAAGQKATEGRGHPFPTGTLRFLCVLCVSAVFCSPSRAWAADLTVFAAASLTDAFQAIGTQFERSHSGTKVNFNFAASSLLRAQIEQGAPADVFASADGEQMRPLIGAGKVRDVVPFARNRLVVATPAANPARIRRLQDLARPGLRLVITAEQVPIGHYTRRALAKMSGPGALGVGFEQRVLANVVSQETNVRGLLAKVELGEADAAIVYASDATAAGPKVRSIPIPARFNEVAVYPAGVVVASAHPTEAGAFARFLQSRPAQAILRRYGFQPR